MASKAAKTGAAVLNAVRAQASPAYKAAVPMANADGNIEDFARPLFLEGQDYFPIQNEFMNVLVNRIAFTLVESKMWNNRLSRLKKGYKAPLGTDIQHIYTNPITPHKYNAAAFDAILKQYDADTVVAYYRRNRQEVFPVTLKRDLLAGAFVSWETFNSFVSNIINAVYSGNEIAEYNRLKQSVNGALQGDYLVRKYVAYPTAENAKDIVKEIKTVASQMMFPRSDFNRYQENAIKNGKVDAKPVITWSERDRLVVLMRSDILNALSVEVLASAFNMTEVEFRANLIEVDSFDYDTYNDDGTLKEHVKSDIGFMIADESLFQVYDNLIRSGGEWNEGNLSWNYFFHVWQSYGICPFADCVVYEVGDSTPPIGVTTDKTVVSLTAEKTNDTVTYTFIPDTASAEMEMTKISAAKDGEAFADDVVTATIDQTGKSVAIEEKAGLATGTYETKYSLHVKGSLYPNTIISVGAVVA